METYDGWANVPPNLKTKTTLKSEGLRLARGQKHVAYVDTRWGRNKGGWYKLYDVSEAIPVKPPTEKQLAAVEKAKAASIEKRTCKGCGYVEELERNWRGKIHVHRQSGLCPDCQTRLMNQQDHDARIEWAKGVLADPAALIVDIESVDIDAEIIELAIINLQGAILFRRRFKPLSKIVKGALAIHGMTAEKLEHEPPFTQYVEPLRFLLGNARVIAYNYAHLKQCLRVTCELHGVAEIEFKGDSTMQADAEFRGDYSSSRGDYNYYPLHYCLADYELYPKTALMDCEAIWNRLHKIAEAEPYLVEAVV